MGCRLWTIFPRLAAKEKQCPAHTVLNVSGAGQKQGFNVLEDQLRSELKYSRVVSRSDCAEVAGPQTGADAAILDVPFELRVVPCVEALRAEFETAAA